MGNIYRLSDLYAVHQIIKENHPILNQVYNILAKLQNQNKQIIHSEIKINDETQITAKQPLGMTGITTTRLPYTD